MKNTASNKEVDVLMEIIRNQWSDIHHTRNQEWTSLAIIGGIIYALFQATDTHLKLAISVFGMIVCILSILMVTRHWLLFMGKIELIKLLYGKIGVNIKLPGFRYSVQSIIVLFYFLLLSALLGWFLWIVSQDTCLAITGWASSFAVGLFICIIISRKIKAKVEKERNNIATGEFFELFEEKDKK